MAYVQPNSIVQLFKGINLDNRYMHTIYFASESAQNSWFSGKVFQTYQQISYVRYTKNQIKLKADATSLFGVTYMRFMNDRADNKWFYAFVNNIEYLNENTALITYEIDVMQTWFIQVGSVRPCMVLREHTNDDTLGNNLEVEPVGSDAYKMDLITKTNLFTALSVIINTTASDETETQVTNETVNNNDLFNGTVYTAVETRDSSGNVNGSAMYNSLFLGLKGLLGGNWGTNEQKAELVDMFTFPSAFSSNNKSDNTHVITINHPTVMGDYTPKNNKMLTYPYTYLGGTTKDGDSAIYRWEYFAGIHTANQVTFTAYGSPIGGGQIICYPHTYDGVVDNLDCKMSMNNFPKNPYSFDAYYAWVASGGRTKLEFEEKVTDIKGVTAMISSASSAMNQATSGWAKAGISANDMYQNGAYASGIANVTSGVNGMIQGTTNLINTAVDVVEAQNKIAYQWKDASYRPDMVLGKATPNVAVSLKELDFHFFNVHLYEDEAKRVDDFFSCYGYATNRVKQPNLTGRAYWNFVQTKDCVIDGDMPASSKEAIGRIFDGGITFWHNGDNIGNYQISTSGGSINNPIS